MPITFNIKVLRVPGTEHYRVIEPFPYISAATFELLLEALGELRLDINIDEIMIHVKIPRKQIN